MKVFRFLKLKFRDQLILSYVLLISLPLLVLGLFSYQSVKGLVVEQSIQHHHTSLMQLANYENNVVDQYVRSIRAITINRQLSAILRRVAIRQPSRGIEYDNYREIHAILHTLTAQDGLLSVKLALSGKANFIAPYFDFFPIELLMQAPFYQEYLAPQQGSIVVLPSSIAQEIRPVSSDSLLFATRLVNWEANNRTLGYLFMEVDAATMLRPLTQFRIPEDSSLLLATPNFTLFHATNPPTLLDRPTQTEVSVFSTLIPSIQGELILSTPAQRLPPGGRNLALLQLATAALLSLAAVSFALYLTRILNRNVQSIIQSIRLIEGGQFSEVPVSSSSDEFGMLQNALHSMSGQIRTLIDNVVIAERRHKEMEFRLLYEQINPHFVYNTLDIVYWEALSAGEEKLAELARTLTDYLRLSLNHGHKLISVRNELEEVEKYIHIINYCFHDCVTLTIHASEAAQEVKIINTILQPLVENAVFHGILAKEEPWGSIDINVKMEDDAILFVVTDDGAGMDCAKMPEYLASNSTHSGLRNVDNRIKAYYGQDSGISVDDTYQTGCRLTVRLNLFADTLSLDSSPLLPVSK